MGLDGVAHPMPDGFEGYGRLIGKVVVNMPSAPE
jgi:hypothetical protein